VYSGPNKIKCDTEKLYEAIKIIIGGSSMGAAAITISIANETKQEGGKMVPANYKYELSVKIHNKLHRKKVNYHSPP